MVERAGVLARISFSQFNSVHRISAPGLVLVLIERGDDFGYKGEQALIIYKNSCPKGGNPFVVVLKLRQTANEQF